MCPVTVPVTGKPQMCRAKEQCPVRSTLAWFKSEFSQLQGTHRQLLSPLQIIMPLSGDNDRSPAFVSLSMLSEFIKCLLNARHRGEIVMNKAWAVPKSSHPIYLRIIVTHIWPESTEAPFVFLLSFPFQSCSKRPALHSHALSPGCRW